MSRYKDPPLCHLDQAALRLHRSGEGTLLVAEKFALQQGLLEGGTVDRHQGAIALGRCGGASVRRVPCQCDPGRAPTRLLRSGRLEAEPLCLLPQASLYL